MKPVTTERLILEPVKAIHAVEFYKLYDENKLHLQPWEPKRDASFYTLDSHVQMCETAEENFLKGTGYSFAIRLKESSELIGRINLNNIVRGVFQNTYFGYFMGQKHNGNGYMTEAVKSAVHLSFNHFGLHRVQAAVIVDNVGSIRVLEKSGFRREGLALRYLRINDQWRDHYLYAITSEEYNC